MDWKRANKRAKIWNFQTNQKRMRVFEPRMGRIRAKKSIFKKRKKNLVFRAENGPKMQIFPTKMSYFQGDK